MNSGIADANNLIWKLAFVFRGLAEEKLLDTYDAERRPLSEKNADFQVQNTMRAPYVYQGVLGGNEDRVRFWMHEFNKHIHSVGQSLGQWYPEGAIVGDGTSPPLWDPEHYHPVDRPGHRFPHIWLDRQRSRSTIDWFDRKLVLVVGAADESWSQAGEEIMRRTSVPLEIRRLPPVDAASGILLGPRGAALVRPDGHVAWRAAWSVADPQNVLLQAMTSIGINCEAERFSPPEAA
jgi:putative polyketide hydroxylase/tetracenomycin A2 monooxygenase-dioxygenase